MKRTKRAFLSPVAVMEPQVTSRVPSPPPEEDKEAATTRILLAMQEQISSLVGVLSKDPPRRKDTSLPIKRSSRRLEVPPPKFVSSDRRYVKKVEGVSERPPSMRTFPLASKQVAPPCDWSSSDQEEPTRKREALSRHKVPSWQEEPVRHEAPARSEEPARSQESARHKAPARSQELARCEALARSEEPVRCDAPARSEESTRRKAPVRSEDPTKSEEPARRGAPARSEEPARRVAPTRSEEPARRVAPTRSEEPIRSQEPARLVRRKVSECQTLGQRASMSISSSPDRSPSPTERRRSWKDLSSKRERSPSSDLLLEDVSEDESPANEGLSNYKTLTTLLLQEYGDLLSPAAPPSPRSLFSSTRTSKSSSFLKMRPAISMKKALQSLD
ncbi:serine-aspartate repeat-containing protein I-like [Macrobrachium nipponense]|uniref:serine-aspartate repeat-containing protein I-like n=1 Tax=Macrobrachium nipponense TaxID=159736 RepID=UPI0030C805BF